MMQVNESYYRIVLWLDTNADLGQCLINEVTAELTLARGTLPVSRTNRELTEEPRMFGVE